MTAALESLTRQILPADRAAAIAARALFDRKTKPRGSLGRLEELACRYAAARGRIEVSQPSKAIVVMAADHGVCEEGVSAYPQAVTAQMLRNFSSGGAAINVLARQVGAEVVVVDMGVKAAPELPGVTQARIANGTKNLARGAAMTEEQALRAIAHGAELARTLAARGVSVIGLGEMGIGNTTSASTLLALLSGLPAREVIGRGTGLDDAGLAQKLAVVEHALRLHEHAHGSPLLALACTGGFELAGLAGVILGAAAQRVPVMLDGFIATCAALVAARIAPLSAGYMLAAHRSTEPGHAHALRALDLSPLLALELRLGEGTGAALALGLLDAAVALLREMATFESAGVDDSGA